MVKKQLVLKINKIQKWFFYGWIAALILTPIAANNQYINEIYQSSSLITIAFGILFFINFWLIAIYRFFKQSKEKAVKLPMLSVIITIIWIFVLIIIPQEKTSKQIRADVEKPKTKRCNISEYQWIVVDENTNCEKEIKAFEETKIVPSPAPTYKPIDQYANNPDLKNAEWGEAVQKESGSYTIKVGMDEKMTTPNELYEALMSYRQVKGKSRLTWNDKLASYATERALYICQNGSDQHAGFNDFINNQNGFDILGYRHLGENMSYGMRMSGVHLIEWIYSTSPGHEANQTGQWSHIGVGIAGDCSVLIFGNYKI